MNRVPIRLPAKRSKYGNVPTTIDGFRFDSKKEAARYLVLKQMQGAGLISELIADKRMLKFPIRVNDIPICWYVADFSYFRADSDKPRVIEDVKGCKTAVYRLKKALMKAVHGIEIAET